MGATAHRFSTITYSLTHSQDDTNWTPEWGTMVADGVLNFNYWWIGAFPGLAILTMAVGTNFIGDSLRDFLDPRLRKEL